MTVVDTFQGEGRWTVVDKSGPDGVRIVYARPSRVGLGAMRVVGGGDAD